MQHNTDPQWIREFRDSITSHAITTSEKTDLLLTLDACADEIERLRAAPVATNSNWIVCEDEDSAFGGLLVGPNNHGLVTHPVASTYDWQEACLIAAAPDLLDALQELAGWQTTAPPEVVEAAQRAIERAAAGAGL